MQIQKKKKLIDIKPTSSHFVEVSQETKNPYTLTLVEGQAEILGAEIMPNRPIVIQPGEGVTIYSWTGCSIQCQSESQLPDSIGIGLSALLHGGYSQNPMQIFIKIHFDLTEARKSALDNNCLGPRIIILGDQPEVKKQIWTVFLNYTTKMNMKPIFVDLDTKNDIFCDGFIGAVEIQGQYPKDFFNYKKKLVYFYGKQKPVKKPYLLSIQNLAKNTIDKLQKQLKNYENGNVDCQYPSFCSGIIVNIPSQSSVPFWKQLLKQTINQFKITHAIVIQDKNILAHLLKQHATIERLNISKLDTMKPSYSHANRKIDLYFTGDPRSNLKITIEKKIQKLNINQTDIYELKIGADQTPYCIKLDLSSMQIVKAVITVLHAKNDITDQHALGLRVITSPVCCLFRIHEIQNGELIIHTIEQKFLDIHKNSLFVYGRII